MGLFDRIMGKAGEADADAIESESAELLGPGESVQAAYKLVRDLFVFTDWRLVLVDRQGLSGNKVEYQSIPYASIRRFAVETAGTFDRDAELTLWIAGRGEPMEKEFGKTVDVYELQSVLAMGVSKATGGQPTREGAPSGGSGGDTVFSPES